MASEATPNGTLAAIDIGSNSFRLELGRFDGGSYRRIDYLKQTVRLGAGLDGDGKLTEDAIARGLACLRGFAQRLDGVPATHIRAVATQTLREAQNRNAFLERACEALGHPVEVISGREEARLIYAGVNLLQPSDTSRLVVDIGGRSTELILGTGPLARAAESFPVGCVSASQRFFPQGRLEEAGMRAAQIAAGALLEEGQATFERGLWQEALGASGTAGAVSQILAAAKVTDGRITPQGLRWMMQRCVAAGHVDRIELPALKPDRRAVLPGGLAVLYAVFANFGIEEMQPTRGALRHGVLGDLAERLAAEQAVAQEGEAAGHGRGHGRDVRDRTVPELQRRFAVDVVQAERVRRVALALFDAAPRTLLGGEAVLARRELAWAASLHELGLIVSHHDHHRHSAYLMAKVDAAGFSQDQQLYLSQLLLGQRGGLKKMNGSLGDPSFAWQLLCLRLAVIKCHARDGVDAQALRLEPRGQRSVRLIYDARWAQQRVRTVYLLAEEAEAWGRHGPFRLELPA